MLLVATALLFRGRAYAGAAGFALMLINLALVLVAAESRAGRLDRARAALKDFHAVVPQARTVAAIKAWRLPHAMLPDTPAFWEALRRAGVGA